MGLRSLVLLGGWAWAALLGLAIGLATGLYTLPAPGRHPGCARWAPCWAAEAGLLALNPLAAVGAVVVVVASALMGRLGWRKLALGVAALGVVAFAATLCLFVLAGR